MDFQDASEKIDEIVETIDDNIDDIPDAGVDYFENTKEFLTSVQQTIANTLRVTTKQRDAILNCESGIQKWIDNLRRRRR